MFFLQRVDDSENTHVCPTYKKGDVTDVQITDLLHYYALSLRSYMYMYNKSSTTRFYLYIHVHPLLSKQVWLPSKQILSYQSNINLVKNVDSIDKKHSCNVIYLNFQKAFRFCPTLSTGVQSTEWACSFHGERQLSTVLSSQDFLENNKSPYLLAHMYLLEQPRAQ